MTADHKALNEEQESRLHHKHAVVVQDLGTQWVHSYPCKNQISSGDDEKSSKILTPRRNSEDHFYEQFCGIDWSLRRPELEP